LGREAAVAQCSASAPALPPETTAETRSGARPRHITRTHARCSVRRRDTVPRGAARSVLHAVSLRACRMQGRTHRMPGASRRMLRATIARPSIAGPSCAAPRQRGPCALRAVARVAAPGSRLHTVDPPNALLRSP
jgi:hypothetical protein